MKKRKKELKKIPVFSSEREEARFWERADSTLYFPSGGRVHLKMPSRTETISLRLPKRLLERIKKLAALRDVPYQSLMKIYIDNKVREEITNLS